MTKKDQVSSSHRINEAMLDEMLAGTDAAAMFHSGELLSELRQRLAERILDAEMEVHLDQQVAGERGNTRNGHNRMTVLTDDRSMPLAVQRDRQGTFEPQLVERHCRRLPGCGAGGVRDLAAPAAAGTISDCVSGYDPGEGSGRRLGDQPGGLSGGRSGRERPQGNPGPVVGGEGRCAILADGAERAEGSAGLKIF